MNLSLGIDIGSSSVKVSLMDIATGECVGSSTNPQQEMPIDAVRSGWAEQDPDMWWDYVKEGIAALCEVHSMAQVSCIGITYQMHGLVVIDAAGRPLRKAIIWCDSRAVEIGAEAFAALGPEMCLAHTLNSPGNFTASKLAWVKRNEPELFAKIQQVMLPGDYIAYRLSGSMSTTDTGLSEGIMWDFKRNTKAKFVTDYYGIPEHILGNGGCAIGVQAHTNARAEAELGITSGTPISYRAGDQPNNAFSLNVMESGEIAATGGTSGVVYGVIDTPKYDPQSRVNPFLHVNHTAENPRYGVLLCINGAGIANAWVRRNIARELDYAQMNALAATVGAGSDGVVVLPFGNGAERMLGNRFTKAEIAGLDLNRHTTAHIARATQEGIAFAFRYGIDIMKQMGLQPKIIRAGLANLFQSGLFCTTLSTLCDARIELFNTDGALGAARGAALGAGFFSSRDQAFASLKRLKVIEPDPSIRDQIEASYAIWIETLENRLK